MFLSGEMEDITPSFLSSICQYMQIALLKINKTSRLVMAYCRKHRLLITERGGAAALRLSGKVA